VENTIPSLGILSQIAKAKGQIPDSGNSGFLPYGTAQVHFLTPVGPITPHPYPSTRDVEAFSKKITIAYRPDTSKRAKLWWHAVAVFFKRASTSGVPKFEVYRIFER